METNSIFSDVTIGCRHSATALAPKIAGGKSFLSDEMFAAAHLANDNGPAWISDIDRFIDAKLVNMFERDENGNPCIEQNTIRGALRKAAVQLGHILVSSAVDGKTTHNVFASRFIEKSVNIVEKNIPLWDNHTGSSPKYGQLMPIEFKDPDGVYNIRYVEVFRDVYMNFTIESIHATNAWPTIWRLAEDNGLGGARHHGYGKFVITDWS